jgi:hypothetical protein
VQAAPQGRVTATLAERFRDQAAACERSGSRLYADLCRLLADEPLVRGIAANERWDVPVRLLGGLHYLLLDGRAQGWRWADVRETLERERDWLARFVAEQPVQTNEVQRCWALLPAFLALGERPLDLIELGASGGLNLLWDRYRYRYAAGSWGSDDAELELVGEERGTVPARLLHRRPEVRRRRGIDLEPLELHDPDAARLLECFVWPDQHERIARLRQALELARRKPPDVIRGDYVELLPSLLADRDPQALTVVFQTVSTVYLAPERYEELRRVVDAAEPPVAWISTRRFTEETMGIDGGFELELRRPGEASPGLAATMGYHGQWLDWLLAAPAGGG